ncbi:hypothetical protein, partial [Nonomuraea diastatica]|uniref:hypothetical protein n=1 Tax=Nonomuraea diastatica TaxID=1848329 RepID=UPI003CCC8AB7
DGFQDEVLAGLAAAAGLGAGALGLDPRLAGGQVQVLDVEGEDFLGPGGGLVQEPVESLLPQTVFPFLLRWRLRADHHVTRPRRSLVELGAARIVRTAS